jgi:hypothetical protein
MNEYYRGNPPVLACLDEDAISRKRPERYKARDEHIIHAKEGEIAEHVENMEGMEA